MGALNTKVMGAIAQSFGDNTVYPSPVLSPVLSMDVDADRYRRRFRQASVSQILTGESFWQVEFEPGEDESWDVLLGTVVSATGAADDLRANVSVINPIDNNLVISPASIRIMKGMRQAWCGPGASEYGDPPSYSPINIYVPSGSTLRVQISNEGLGVFGAGAALVELLAEILPKQEEFSKLAASSSVVS